MFGTGLWASSATGRKPLLKPCHHNCTTTTTTTTTTTPPPPTGTVAVLLVNFSDDIRQPWTPGYITDLFNGPDTPNVADFYQQSSFAQLAMTADVYGWYILAQPTTGCNLSAVQMQADAAAAAAGVDLSPYAHKVYLFPSTSQCGFSGTADAPGKRVWINLDTTGCPGPPSPCQTFHTLPHELGHNLGLDHAGTYICTDAAGNHVVLSNTCTFQELGDQFDDMGCCTPSLFSNVRRLQLGWTPLSQIVTITSSGAYTIPPASLQASPVYRVADGTGQYLYLENRAAAEPPTWPSGWPDGNLLVRRAPDINLALAVQPQTQLLDCSPADNDAIPNAKGCPVGSSFTLPNTPVTIANVGFDGTNNTVQVTFG